MARVVVLGGGIAGHTAALHLTRMLKRSDEVVVVTPNSNWNWIPSNIWVGVGKMKTDQVTFTLGPIYKRKGIEFHQALATAIHPEGGPGRPKPYAEITYTDPARAGERVELEYDYLINATGPKLNFGATPGLGPDGHSYSVCTSGHAVEASAALQASINRDAAGRAPSTRGRDGAWHLHLRGRGVRVRVQRRARGAPGRHAGPGRHRLPDQRVRTRRLRRRWTDLHPAGVPDDVQALDRVTLPRAGDPGDQRCPRHTRRGRRRPLRAAGRFQQFAVRSTSPCCCRRSAGWTSRRSTPTGRTSAPSFSPPAAS